MSNSIQSYEILETLRMVSDQNFDVRTITIGIDLHDCISDNIDVLNQNIYDKIVRIMAIWCKLHANFQQNMVFLL